MQGKKVGMIDLPAAVFGLPWNAALVKQVVEAELANHRAGTAHTKNRGEVSGGGKKPWRQKGRVARGMVPFVRRFGLAAVLRMVRGQSACMTRKLTSACAARQYAFLFPEKQRAAR